MPLSPRLVRQIHISRSQLSTNNPQKMSSPEWRDCSGSEGHGLGCTGQEITLGTSKGNEEEAQVHSSELKYGHGTYIDEGSICSAKGPQVLQNPSSPVIEHTDTKRLQLKHASNVSFNDRVRLKSPINGNSVPLSEDVGKLPVSQVVSNPNARASMTVTKSTHKDWSFKKLRESHSVGELLTTTRSLQPLEDTQVIGYDNPNDIMRSHEADDTQVIPEINEIQTNNVFCTDGDEAKDSPELQGSKGMVSLKSYGTQIPSQSSSMILSPLPALNLRKLSLLLSKDPSQTQRLPRVPVENDKTVGLAAENESCQVTLTDTQLIPKRQSQFAEIEEFDTKSQPDTQIIGEGSQTLAEPGCLLDTTSSKATLQSERVTSNVKADQRTRRNLGPANISMPTQVDSSFNHDDDLFVIESQFIHRPNTPQSASSVLLSDPQSPEASSIGQTENFGTNVQEACRLPLSPTIQVLASSQVASKDGFGNRAHPHLFDSKSYVQIANTQLPPEINSEEELKYKENLVICSEDELDGADDDSKRLHVFLHRPPSDGEDHTKERKTVIGENESESVLEDSLETTHRKRHLKECTEVASKYQAVASMPTLSAIRPAAPLIEELQESQTSTAEQQTLNLPNSRQNLPDPNNCRQVWAFYNYRFYPGFLVSKGPIDLVVEFSDGALTIKNEDIHPLKLKIGDLVNIRTERVKYKLTGLKNIADHGITTLDGFNVLLIERAHKPNNNRLQKLKQCREVALVDCHISLEDWYAQNVDGGSKSFHRRRLDTPRDIFSAKPKRSAAVTAAFLTAAEATITVDGPIETAISPIPLAPGSSPKVPPHAHRGVFTGMMFSFTSLDEEEKSHLRKKVQIEGGVYVEDLDEIFIKEQRGTWTLRAEYQDLHFAAVVAREYCRSAKYLQALALGWPIVSFKFIECCSEGYSKPMDWPLYLLPAGECTALDRAVRSFDPWLFRTVYNQGRPLSDQLGHHHHFLRDFTILACCRKGQSRLMLEFMLYLYGVKAVTYRDTPAAVLNSLRHLERPILIYDEFGSVTRAIRKRPKQLKEVGLIDWEWVAQTAIAGRIGPYSNIG